MEIYYCNLNFGQLILELWKAMLSLVEGKRSFCLLQYEA
jgi:hypothetical protein